MLRRRRRRHPAVRRGGCRMRLHRLEVTAFGPFAETTTVDFDALSAAGLFLLSGATGAGKTSVLDAVCFALYGAVPGERNDARRLRSDQAAADTPPRVVLDATLAGRRFRIVRSPAWSRPKKRGSGTTPQQASVVISERVDGAWVPLSTRLDETGHLVTALVGMNLTQFTQVAMLPQGRFQAFLRASSEDRHRLLQQLFRTERFEQVERWLRDRRLDLRQRSDDHDRVVGALVHRVSETADVALPDHTEEPTEWSAALLGAVRQRAEQATKVAPSVQASEQAARAGLDTARAVMVLRRRHADAVRERDELAQRHDEIAAAASGVDDAARARAVLPLHRVAQRCRASYDAAEARAGHAREAVASLLRVSPADLDPAAVAQRIQQAADDAATARALAPREAERLDLVGRLRDVEALRLAAAEAGRRARGPLRGGAPRAGGAAPTSGCGAGSGLAPSGGRAGGGRRRAQAGRRTQPAGPAQRARRGPARPQPLRRRTPGPDRGAAHPPAGPHRGDGRRAGRAAGGRGQLPCLRIRSPPPPGHSCCRRPRRRRREGAPAPAGRRRGRDGGPGRPGQRSRDPGRGGRTSSRNRRHRPAREPAGGRTLRSHHGPAGGRRPPGSRRPAGRGGGGRRSHHPHLDASRPRASPSSTRR